MANANSFEFPILWLRLEGLAALSISVLLYARAGGSLGLFLLLILVPDVSMLGYLQGPRLGASLYNLVHTYVFPILLAGGLLLWHRDPRWLPYLLIWTAHIGMDRAMGYGLKYASNFGDTHLGKLGKHERASQNN